MSRAIRTPGRARRGSAFRWSSRPRPSPCCSARSPSTTAFRVAEAVLMSATIYGGASQMVGIELFGQKVAPWLIVLSIFAVNFRHVLYSAAVGRRIAHWPPAQQAHRLLPADRSAICRNRAQGRSAASRSPSSGISGWRCRSMCSGSLEAWDRRRVRQADPRSACARPRFPAADLFPRPGHGVPQAAAVAAGGDGERASRRSSPTRPIGSPWHVSVGALAGIVLAAAMPPVTGQGGDVP